MEAVARNGSTEDSGLSGSRMNLDLWVAQYANYKPEQPLSKEDMNALVVLSRNGDQQATNQLIASMLGLLVKRARAQGADEEDLTDLLNEGVCGILTAVNRFEPSRDVKFITYADFWIRHFMNEHTMRTHCVQGTHRARRLERRVRGVSGRLLQELGRKPNPDEIARELGVEVGDVVAAQALGQSSVSADQLNDNEQTLVEFFEGAPSNYEASIDQGRLKTLMEEALLQLKPEVRAVVVKAMGVDCHEMSYAEIGKDLGVGRQAVHQQAKRGMTKMKKYLLSKGVGGDVLKSFL